MSLQTRLDALITAIGADIKALQAAIGGTPNQYNGSTANQTIPANADTLLNGSTVAFPTGTIKAGTIYRCKFNVAKTNAGTASPVINVRVGTAGTAADAARVALTFAAQTAAIDEGIVEVDCLFRTSGATAQLQAVGRIGHRLATTGLSTSNESVVTNTNAGFDVTTAGLKFSLSINTGASAAWTINFLSAEIVNLA